MKSTALLKFFVGFALLTSITAGCVMEDVKKPASEGEDGESPYSFQGCVDGQGVGTNSIQINFLFPSQATRVRVKRNGNQVAEFSQANSTTSYIDDSGLREGATYLYTCEAFVDGLWAEGTRALQLSTLAVNAPVFPGIQNAVAQSARSVLVTWNPSIVDIPVSAYSYKVYGNIGPDVDWTAAPKATILHGSPGQFLVENLGDQLMYSFGVRACSEGDVCETNTVQRTLTTPNGGVPLTVGVTNLSVQDGKLIITAPWNEQNGGIHRRYVYVRTGATGGLNIGDYVLQRTYQLSGAQLYGPPQTLELPSIQQGITYHIIVQDEDITGLRSAVTNFRTLTTTDITPPAFAGITALTEGSPSDSVLVARWTAIPTEAIDPAIGGVNYRIFALNSATPIATNPCLFGTQIAEIPVANYTAGDLVNYDITGLAEKTYYSICVKAVDALGNVSTNNNYQQSNTKDITPPEFFGIQNLAYSNQIGQLQATWSPSASEDIKEYRVKIWKNQVTPPASPTIIVRSHAVASTGTSISGAEYSISDGDSVYVNVEACDRTESPLGTQNCTALNTQRTISLPDVTPPPGFLGIRGATDIETPAEGSLLVKWHAPADWSDYRGFNIYTVNPSTQDLTLIGTALCANASCAAPADRVTEYQIDGRDPFRTYRLHVRAFDAQNNETIYLNPATSFADKRTSDTTPPTFNSNLLIGPAPDFTLSWNVATDNQYNLEPGAVVEYEVYQNNAPFDFSGEQPNGNLKVTTTQLSFQDSGFDESQTYYYTVCAMDASDNRTCDQTERSVTIPDVTEPVIRNLTSDKTIKAKVWELSWEMEDNITTPEDLFIEIRRRVSVNGDLATPSDTLLYSGPGADAISAGNLASTVEISSLDPLSGPENENRKINYLVTVMDQSGNSDSANITVESDNSIQLTSIKSQQGPTSGLQLVAIYGKGFTKGVENRIGVDSVVTIGGNPCTNLEVISEEAILCLTPIASVSGSVEVRVRSRVNMTAGTFSEASLVNGYTYSSSHICNNPGTWGPTFAAGTGTDAANAYVICNLTHLNNIRTMLNAGSYFRLAANLDLDGETFNPLGTSLTKFTGNFNGDGHIIRNWTHTTSTAASGLFGYVAGNFQITNLGLVNVNLSGGQSTGGLIGVAEGGTNITGLMSKVFVTGNIEGSDYVGGILGRKQAPHINFNLVDSYFVGSISATGTTGYGGGLVGFTGLDAGGLFQNIYSEGSVSGTRYVGGLMGQIGTGKQLLSSYSRAEVSATEGFAGGLVGESRLATVNNSYVEGGSVSGVNAVGGLIGTLSGGTLNNSVSKIEVTSTGRQVGGAVGLATGASILNSHAERNVEGVNATGGLIGEVINSTVTNSYALGNVDSTGDEVGGLVGKLNVEASATSSFNKVYANGSVQTPLSGVGGLFGAIDMLANSTLTLSEAFSSSQVGASFTLPNQQYGGLIGKLNTRAGAQANISDCYASGDVYGGNYVGGLIGGYDNSAGIVRVRRCYSSASVFGGESGRGGLFGNTLVASHDVLDTYWDTQKSTKAFASGNGSYTGSAQGYATAIMLDYANSIYVGWDFVSVWAIPAEGYPRLVFE